MDEYSAHLKNYTKTLKEEKVINYENPVWHIHSGNPPNDSIDIQFSLLLNLVSASNSINKEILWGFLKNYYDADLLFGNEILVDNMIGFAINYFNDFVKPNKTYRAPSDKEKLALMELKDVLDNFNGELDPENIQTEIYRIGKEHHFDPLRNWFSAIYEVLLGQKDGPRFGSFVLLYGIKNTQNLIENALAGKFINNS